jgi:hypothetical protein
MRRFLAKRDDWCMISGELSGMTQEERETATAKLLGEILEGGFAPLECEGVYKGESERSFLVIGISSDEALRLGRMFHQESIMLPAGLTYCDDGRTVPIQSIEDGASGDSYSRVSVGGRRQDLTITLAA